MTSQDVIPFPQLMKQAKLWYLKKRLSNKNLPEAVLIFTASSKPP